MPKNSNRCLNANNPFIKVELSIGNKWKMSGIIPFILNWKWLLKTIDVWWPSLLSKIKKNEKNLQKLCLKTLIFLTFILVFNKYLFYSGTRHLCLGTNYRHGAGLGTRGHPCSPYIWRLYYSSRYYAYWYWRGRPHRFFVAKFKSRTYGFWWLWTRKTVKKVKERVCYVPEDYEHELEFQ